MSVTKFVREQWKYFTYANKPDFTEMHNLYTEEERKRQNVDHIQDHNVKFAVELDCINQASNRTQKAIDDYYEKVGWAIGFFMVPVLILVSFGIPLIMLYALNL